MTNAAVTNVSPSGRVLVVEDNADHRTILALALREEGYEVVEIADGAAAIDYLLGNPEPDVVLLDLILPQLSGWDVLRVLRTYLRLRRIPVIVATGQAAAVQVPYVNVIGRLQKPYRLDELFALLRQCPPVLRDASHA
jgi:CheY-like chemotaxis protein